MDIIYKAVISGNLELLGELLKTGENVDTQDKIKRTLLINAVLSNKIEVVKFLISNGANINAKDNLGNTALHYAAQNYLLDITKILLENKAEIDTQDQYGNTPLSNAVFYSKGRGELIKILLSFGADKNLENKSGVSPIQLAKTIANYDVTEFFED